jgi:hydroxymethylpyrimidine pyrophosphatase-like HAD family hydrolase
MDLQIDRLAAAEQQLREFLETSSYATNGGIVTDLDGTLVHEEKGRVYIPQPVELALKKLYERGRPLMINSLRFPLSVLRTFGKEWCEISGAPIPAVSLNGSQVGLIKADGDELVFEEIDATPLEPSEIEDILAVVKRFVDGGVKELLVFYYPRDWRKGELIWTPMPKLVLPVKGKYMSASGVTAVKLDTLHKELLAEDICMIFLLVDVPQDTLMAYQHANRSSFYTHKGVDKLSGSRLLAKHLNFDLIHSLGAGDSPMDTFLTGVGMAAVVGREDLPYHGLTSTIHLRDSLELGEFLRRFARLQGEIAA